MSLKVSETGDRQQLVENTGSKEKKRAWEEGREQRENRQAGNGGSRVREGRGE